MSRERFAQVATQIRTKVVEGVVDIRDKAPEKLLNIGANLEMQRISKKKDKVLEKRKELVTEIEAKIQAEKEQAGERTEAEIEADVTQAILQEKTADFKRRLREPNPKTGKVEELDDLLPEAFAVVSVAAEEVLGQTPYDVQIMGGIALHMGRITEMNTGEGKTLTSLMPVYLNALTGEGVHVITANEYLVQRDRAWMGQVHEYLGLSVGMTLSNRPLAEKQEAYRSDITYGTATEFGHDYLRDNMAGTADAQVQRGHKFAVVDEADSILIDEARTPLIISGEAEAADVKRYTQFAKVAAAMREGIHYTVDDVNRTVATTEKGDAFAERRLKIENLYDTAVWGDSIGYLRNALQAKELFARDDDYFVRNDRVYLIGEHTGRTLYGRSYNEGMQQAIEAKEGVPITDQKKTQATITLQNYFRKYQRLSGMTGTAQGEAAAEFKKVYKVPLTVITPHRPLIREDHPDKVYLDIQSKFNAVATDVATMFFEHGAGEGRPILIGTKTVEESEMLSEMLQRRGVPHNVLNAKNDQSEAEVVAQAGRKGAVTIATNMAGRGTDILLGGNPEGLTRQYLVEEGLSDADYGEVFAAMKEITDSEHDEVVDLGGLYVMGTQRYDSQRIDKQLRGRAGRQGEPGDSQLYLSLDDELLQRFNGDKIRELWERLHGEGEEYVQDDMLTRRIMNAQYQVEQQNSDIRKNLLKYDEVLNVQRNAIYRDRQKLLDGQDVRGQVFEAIDSTVDAYVSYATDHGGPDEWDLTQLWADFAEIRPLSFSATEVLGEAKDERDQYGDPVSANVVRERIRQRVVDAYHTRYNDLIQNIDRGGGEGAMATIERSVLLSSLDRRWKEHLYEMESLKDGIGLRAIGQRDPLTEYGREGFALIQQLEDSVREDAIKILLNLSRVSFFVGKAPRSVAAN